MSNRRKTVSLSVEAFLHGSQAENSYSVRKYPSNSSLPLGAMSTDNTLSIISTGVQVVSRPRASLEWLYEVVDEVAWSACANHSRTMMLWLDGDITTEDFSEIPRWERLDNRTHRTVRITSM